MINKNETLMKLELRMSLLIHLFIFVLPTIRTNAETTSYSLSFRATAIKTDSIRTSDIYSTEISGGGAKKFVTARYTLYIPRGLAHIKGIFIHQHGCTMEGTGAPITTDLQYQTFAEKWGLAILGPDLTPHDKNCMEWSKPENGSDLSLQKGLKNLASLSGHQELISAPWLLWGHSGGGNWVLSMLSKYPEHIIAAFCYSPAFNQKFSFPEAVNKVPIMIRHAGSKDFNVPGIECWETALNTFSTLRNRNGLISIAYTHNQTHNFSFARCMVIPFFESVLAQRLPLKGSLKLRYMDAAKAWLGDTSSIDTRIYKANVFIGNKLNKSWLPDSLCAEKYKEYVMTGTVKDISYPLPPTHARVKSMSDKTFDITWKAKADIESGIKYFIIYKNHQYLDRFPSTLDFQVFDTNGDNPVPAVTPLMSYRIKEQLINRTDIFEVSVVNHAGLESSKIKADFLNNMERPIMNAHVKNF